MLPLMLLLDRLGVDEFRLGLVFGNIWNSLVLQVNIVVDLVLLIVFIISRQLTFQNIIIVLRGIVSRIELIKAYGWLLGDRIIP